MAHPCVWAEGASENVLHEAFLDVLRLSAGPSTAALRRDIGESAAKAAERRPDAAGEVDFLEHCFIAEAVLIGSSITSRLGRNDPRVPSTKL